MASEDERLLAQFEAWLNEEKYQGHYGSLRWPELVKRIDNSEKSAVTFFVLFEEFLLARGQSLADVEQWKPRGWEPRASSVKGGGDKGT